MATISLCVCKRAAIFCLSKPCSLHQGREKLASTLQFSLRKWTPRLRVPVPTLEPQIQNRAPFPKPPKEEDAGSLILTGEGHERELYLAVQEVPSLSTPQLLQALCLRQLHQLHCRDIQLNCSLSPDRGSGAWTLRRQVGRAT